MSDKPLSNVRNAFAAIMAGGNGERFWPLSTVGRPKQFLDIFGGKALIRHAADRLEGLLPPERIFVITAARLAEATRAALPALPAANVIGEPCRRDTAAAVARACGIVLARGGAGAVGCVLTADQLMSPAEEFRQTLADAIEVAAAAPTIVTVGIRPTRPDTGFGYIECGERLATPSLKTAFRRAARFVEKPDAGTARKYLETGRFAWNSGMFVWRADAMRAAFAAAADDFLPLVDGVAAAAGPQAAVDALYPGLRTVSVDYAVMERAPSVTVAESPFAWDDVGSWTAVERHFPADAEGNVLMGKVATQRVARSTVVNRGGDGHVVAVAGLEDVVVVHTPEATLVCSKAEAARLKPLVQAANVLY